MLTGLPAREGGDGLICGGERRGWPVPCSKPGNTEGDVGPHTVCEELRSGLIRVGNREDETSNARCRMVTLLQTTYESDEPETEPRVESGLLHGDLLNDGCRKDYW